MFEKYTKRLWAFANSSEPFSCKDIEITLSELTEEKKQTKDLTEKLENKVTELKALESNRSQLETDLEKVKNNLNQTNIDLKTESAKNQILEEINENRTSELANSIKKLNEIKNKSSEAETIKMLEEVIQGLNGKVENLTTVAGNTVIKVIRVVEFSSRGYKIEKIFA